MRCGKLLLLLLLLPVLMIGGNVVSASSEENVDSFNAHPINRWTELKLGVSASIVNGMLNMSDVGDNSTDAYSITRALRDLDGTVEVRFKMTSGATSDHNDNKWYVYLGTGNFRAYFSCYDIGDGEVTDTRISIYDVDGNLDLKSMSATEDLHEGFWYVLRVDYDTLQSVLRFRVYFENGTKVLDHNSYDVTSDDVAFFSQTSLSMSIVSSSYTNNLQRNDYVDYVKAPFKERVWAQTDTPVDANYLQDSWCLARASDALDETSAYTLTVPFLDSVSGILRVELPNRDHATFTTAGDRIAVSFYVYAVDADDGDLHEAVFIQLSTYEDSGGDKSDLELELDNLNVITLGAYTDTSADVADCFFMVNSINARSTLTVQVEVAFDGIDVQQYYGEVDISDVATDPSQEFVLKVAYICDLDMDTEIMAAVTSFDLITRMDFSDLQSFANDPITSDDPTGIGGVIAAILGWFHAILIAITDPVTEFLDPLFKDVDTWLTSLGTSITTAVGNILGGLAALMADVMDAVVTWLGTVTNDLFGWIIGIWEGIPFLSDVGDILGNFMTEFLAMAAMVPQGITDSLTYIDYWAFYVPLIMLIGVLLFSMAHAQKHNSDLRIGFAIAFLGLMIRNVNPFKGGSTLLTIVPYGFYVPFGVFALPIIMWGFLGGF